MQLKGQIAVGPALKWAYVPALAPKLFLPTFTVCSTPCSVLTLSWYFVSHMCVLEPHVCPGATCLF